MRTTPVLLAVHIGRGFKVQWMIRGHKEVYHNRRNNILEANGIKIFEPKEILSPPFKRERIILPPLVKEEELREKKESCYLFGRMFSPPAGLAQIQCLTNTVVRTTLPKYLLDCITESSAEVDSKVQAAILHAQLLDSYQEKLPRLVDVSRPGWSFPRDYGMPLKRKNRNMIYQLMLLLEQLYPEPVAKEMMTCAEAKVFCRLNGRLFWTCHKAAFAFASTVPLMASADEAEILGTEIESLPDIYPLSPFLHCKSSTQYSDEEYGCVASSKYYPHTLFFHVNMPHLPHTEDTFSGLTLLKAFTHAAAYAKCWCKVENGVLKRPLAVQVVHTNGKTFHVGVFQLNTLDLNGKRKNIFWHIPSERLFENCSFKVAKGELEGYNPRIFSLLKAFHMH